jgi:hypothetical protein
VLRKGAFVLGLSCACATVSLAQPADLSSSGDQQADIFVKVWRDTCGKFFGNPDELKSAVKAYRFQENPPYATSVLGGVPGTVWDASLGPLAQNTVILFEDGRCQVRGARATNRLVLETFERVMMGVVHPGLSIEKVSDSEIVQAAIKFRQVAYFLSRTDADVGWAFAATVTESTAVRFQATITIGKSRKPAK